ncbi:hypothetical protein AgCh_009147 [Apium graveolens]
MPHRYSISDPDMEHGTSYFVPNPTVSISKHKSNHISTSNSSQKESILKTKQSAGTDMSGGLSGSRVISPSPKIKEVQGGEKKLSGSKKHVPSTRIKQELAERKWKNKAERSVVAETSDTDNDEGPIVFKLNVKPVEVTGTVVEDNQDDVREEAPKKKKRKLMKLDNKLQAKQDTVLITMGDPVAPTKALMDFSQPTINDIQSSIVRPVITANTFEIKPRIIQMKFLTKFFPMAKTATMRSALTQFLQQSEESLCEAWEHYREMLWKCTHHGMPD